MGGAKIFAVWCGGWRSALGTRPGAKTYPVVNGEQRRQQHESGRERCGQVRRLGGRAAAGQAQLRTAGARAILGARGVVSAGCCMSVRFGGAWWRWCLLAGGRGRDL